MKRYFYAYILVAVFSCKEEETQPIEPHIILEEVTFGQGSSSPTLPDTVTVQLSYTDGDGDFGLDRNDGEHLKPPYHQGFFYLKSTGEPVTSDKVLNFEVEVIDLVRLSDRQNSPYDTLPDRSDICHYYTSAPFGTDPAYFTKNANHVNIMVDVVYEDENGAFVEFDPETQYCDWLDGRVPIAGQEGEPYYVRKGTNKKGELTYRMINYFRTAFYGKKIKLRLSTRDRALHNSNVVETEPISF